jgi:PTH2 family peptidyl-tRNA hydrolase
MIGENYQLIKLIFNHSMEKLPVMYIFVNSDLKMTKGKIASQVGHVVQLITEEIIRQGYESTPTPESYFIYMKWKQNCTKIIKKANSRQLQLLIAMKEARYIIDDGQTQVPPNSLTVVGFYPSAELHEVFQNYKLL